MERIRLLRAKEDRRRKMKWDDTKIKIMKLLVIAGYAMRGYIG